MITQKRLRRSARCTPAAAKPSPRGYPRLQSLNRTALTGVWVSRKIIRIFRFPLSRRANLGIMTQRGCAWVAGSRTIWLGLLVSSLIAGIPARFGGAALAGTVDIFSEAGIGSNNITGNNVAIPVSPVWAVPASSQYEWISYGETGCDIFNPSTGLCTPGPQGPPGTTIAEGPTATFYQTFLISDPYDSGNLYVWADDTAGVWLDPGTVTSGNGDISGATLEWAPDGSLGPNCANAPISCIPGGDAVIPLNLTTGTYTLVIDAYDLQTWVSSSLFGVMYDGVLTNTPEPASYTVMGLGLAGLGALLRLRKQAKRKGG